MGGNVGDCARARTRHGAGIRAAILGEERDATDHVERRRSFAVERLKVVHHEAATLLFVLGEDGALNERARRQFVARVAVVLGAGHLGLGRLVNLEDVRVEHLRQCSLHCTVAVRTHAG